MSSTEVILLLLFVVLFFPSTYMIYSSEGGSRTSYIMSLMWRVLFYRDGRVELGLEPYIFDLHLFGLKFLVIFQVYKYFKHSTTKKRVLIIVLLSELQAFLVADIPFIIQAFQGTLTWTSFNWFIPIPVTLIVTCIVLIFVPRPESEPMWIDKEETKSWWKMKQI
ncbi:hypothetical protein E4H12_15335 [Candidatus Thorarchaeota archaeon]|nr:MAG: hypothetical protein E4H12_15335 [Candidatus Thorarchaeota archaeon]